LPPVSRSTAWMCRRSIAARLSAEASADSLAAMERRHIQAVLRETGGNRDEAARRLGISRKTIDRKRALWNA